MPQKQSVNNLQPKSIKKPHQNIGVAFLMPQFRGTNMFLTFEHALESNNQSPKKKIQHFLKLFACGIVLMGFHFAI
jgi:hypothetical protein